MPDAGPERSEGRGPPTAGLFREATGSAHRAPRAGLLAVAEDGIAAAARTQDDLAPLALYERDGGLVRIVSLCERARRAGLARGASLAEARARFPHFAFEPADRGADMRLLDAVADWCDRYTPLVALDGARGILMDITGCAHLFGGEAAMMADLLARLTAQGLAGQAAIAPSAGPALALAAFVPGTILAAGAELEALRPLPVRALRFPPDTAAILDRLGLRCVGDILSQPRASLGRRFGAAFLDRLDTGTGQATRPISPRRPVPQLIHERRLFEPIGRVEDIEGLILHLATRLKPDLERSGQGARQLELSLFRVDGVVERILLATSRPLRDPERVRRLFSERLKAIGDERDAGYGYDLLRLAVMSMAPLAERQTGFSQSEDSGEALTVLVDRLAARLGPESVLSLAPVASHWPEAAQRLVPGLAPGLVPGLARARDVAPERSLAMRPLRLLHPAEPVEAMAVLPEGEPVRFVWRRAVHRVLRIEGPERIEPEWWRRAVPGAEPEPPRDYFRIEDEEGRRYWMFREGLYGSKEPRWFLHGIFA